MVIPVPFFNKNLFIEKRFYYRNPIVSLGCDCHPAFMLDTLHLRKRSLPFDWLRTAPTKGLDFVTANFRDNFKDFLTNLSVNPDGHIVSEAFPYSEFYHDTELITDPDDRERYRRRIKRLLVLKAEKKIDYLYVLSLSDLIQGKTAEVFLGSIKAFLNEIKDIDTLHIYFRWESPRPEELIVFNYFTENTKPFPNVVICLYLRDMRTYGIWGNQEKYGELLSDLKISVRKKMLPGFYLVDK